LWEVAVGLILFTWLWSRIAGYALLALDTQRLDGDVLQWENIDKGWNFVVFASYAVGWRQSGKGRQI